MKRSRRGAVVPNGPAAAGIAVPVSIAIAVTSVLLSGCTPAARATTPERSASGDSANPGQIAVNVEEPFVLETSVDTIPQTTVTFEMIRLPRGTVTLATGETVEVGPLWVQKTETTWDEFDVYALGLDLKTEEDRLNDMVIRPSKPYGAPDRGFGHTGYAAISMSMGVALEYAAWLSHKTGDNYRIPTVAEWQYACMAGREVDPGTDKEGLEERAWFWDNAFDKTHPVGSLEPNPFGLHDMLGNAMEWCVMEEGVPTACGGSYNDKAEAVSCAALAYQTPRWQETDPQIPKSLFWLTDAPFVGFRVVRDE